MFFFAENVVFYSIFCVSEVESAVLIPGCRRRATDSTFSDVFFAENIMFYSIFGLSEAEKKLSRGRGRLNFLVATRVSSGCDMLATFRGPTHACVGVKRQLDLLLGFLKAVFVQITFWYRLDSNPTRKALSQLRSRTQHIGCSWKLRQGSIRAARKGNLWRSMIGGKHRQALAGTCGHRQAGTGRHRQARQAQASTGRHRQAQAGTGSHRQPQATTDDESARNGPPKHCAPRGPQPPVQTTPQTHSDFV